jgi:hypothetical protein
VADAIQPRGLARYPAQGINYMSPHDEVLEGLAEQAQVLDAAMEAFWASIMESCPYINGDMDPVANAQLRAAAAEAVAAWVVLNGGGDDDGQ